MDSVSVRLSRTALLWLVLGFALGALMLSDHLVPGTWQSWFSPTHGHILFVGWFLQFAVGVGYWLLPRKRSSELPLGYREDVALAAYLLLNAGLVLRVIAEPLQRDGHDAALLDWLLAASSALQFAAIAIIAVQLWHRILPRRAAQRPE
jgi:hypothetical protein